MILRTKATVILHVYFINFPEIFIFFNQFFYLKNERALAKRTFSTQNLYTNQDKWYTIIRISRWFQICTTFSIWLRMFWDISFWKFKSQSNLKKIRNQIENVVQIWNQREILIIVNHLSLIFCAIKFPRNYYWIFKNKLNLNFSSLLGNL